MAESPLRLFHDAAGADEISEDMLNPDEAKGGVEAGNPWEVTDIIYVKSINPSLEYEDVSIKPAETPPAGVSVTYALDVAGPYSSELQLPAGDYENAVPVYRRAKIDVLNEPTLIETIKHRLTLTAYVKVA